MPLNTRAYLAKRTIVAGLNTVIGSSDALVSYGFPKGDPPRRWVMLGKIDWQETSWATFPINVGQVSRKEEFSISLVANVQIIGGLEPDVDTALEILSGEIETYLRSNGNLGIPGVWSVEYNASRSQCFPVADAYEGQFEATVKIKART